MPVSERRSVSPSQTRCEMTWIIMPGQTNALGTVFGGQLAAWADVCAAISAQRFSRSTVVTAAMDDLVFKVPIKRGDVAVLQAQVNWAGRTSMEVGVRVEGENPLTGERVHTATAYFTFVCLDPEGRPRPVPELTPETHDEVRRHAEAKERRDARLARRAKERW